MTGLALPEGGVVLDITDPAATPERGARLVTSADLYWRWERQQWSVAQVDPARDAPGWASLSPFSREQLLGALAELEVGEVCVMHTLGSLAEFPPTEDDRIFLCTQLADEARHVRFFQAYLQHACGVDLAGPAGAELEGSADYTHVFAPELTLVTASIRDSGGDPDAWYRALVYYHLVTEGVLAATALRSTRSLARRLRLEALQAGLTNVTRDESRHVSFGLRAAADGVARGFAPVVTDAHFEAIDLAAWVLVGPARYSPVPVLPAALRSRAGILQANVDIAEERLLKQLRLIGPGQLSGQAQDAWQAAIGKALDAYQRRWDAAHPLRAAARLQQN
jgi:ribonucleoside-diphosphate reductase beta chain